MKLLKITAIILTLALGSAAPGLAQVGMPQDRRVDLGKQFKAAPQATPEERRVLLDAQENRVALPVDIDKRVRSFLVESWSYEALVAQKTPVLGTLLLWNEVAMLATALDHTNPSPPGQDPPPYFGEQFGPPRTARVMAIMHIAVDEAVNAISPLNPSYKDIRATILAGLDSAEQQQLRALQVIGGEETRRAINRAIVESAYQSLVELYPKKRPYLDIAYELTLRDFRDPRDPSVRLGAKVGRLATRAVLDLRVGDRPQDSDLTTAGFPSGNPLRWHADPISGTTTALGGNYPNVVQPFLIPSADAFRTRALPGPPPTNDKRFVDCYKQVKSLGGDPNADASFGDRRPTPTIRSGNQDPNKLIPPGVNPNNDQTFVGIFWAYDASAYLCAPPRLYNMIATSVALRELPIDRVEDFAHYLAFVNTTMADAGLAAWDGKYFFVYPRPVTYLREAAADNTPEGAADPLWTPLGAQATNGPGKSANFSPPFPAYPSGHATFGGALFRAMALYFQSAVEKKIVVPNLPSTGAFPEAGVPFTFISDEYNNKNYGAGQMKPRQRVEVKLESFLQAMRLNADSRIYLGVHWSFDADGGIALGVAVAEDAFRKFIKP